MKKSIINFAWVPLAFIIGLTINNACADNLTSDDDTPSTNVDILNRLHKLEDEMEELKSTVIFINTWTTIDGLQFGPDGRVYSKVVKREGTIGILEAITSNGDEGHSTYRYDERGRLSGITITEDWERYTATISYGEKCMKVTCVSTLDDHASTFNETIYYE